MDIKKIYKELTNVDIEDQMRIWDERGRGYYGEYLVFCDIYKYLTGYGKILMNLNIPVDASSTTEVDLLLIHETGIYVFEIKHYKGTIYGQDTDDTWTQYFRTSANSVFKNPVVQNAYHVRALRNLFPNIPIHSCVVFTNDECEIRVVNRNSELDICVLNDIEKVLSKRFVEYKGNVFTMDEVDEIFIQLSQFSQMQDVIQIDSKEADFHSWVKPTIELLNLKKQELENEKKLHSKEIAKNKKIKRIGLIINLTIAIICVIVSIFTIKTKTNENAQEVERFKQNFLHVGDIDNERIIPIESIVNVSNVRLKSYANRSISFTAMLTIANDAYGIMLSKDSKYIVTTKSGMVAEYDMFGSHLKFDATANKLCKGYKTSGNLATIDFVGIVDENDILSIKLTGIDLFMANSTNYILKENIDLELYSNQ